MEVIVLEDVINVRVVYSHRMQILNNGVQSTTGTKKIVNVLCSMKVGATPMLLIRTMMEPMMLVFGKLIPSIGMHVMVVELLVVLHKI